MNNRGPNDRFVVSGGPIAPGVASRRAEPHPFEDELAIDFPAVAAILARICDGLVREDERSSTP